MTLRSASMLKLRATSIAQRSAGLAMKVHGARAYMDDHGPARDIRDAAAWSLAGGSDHTLFNFIAQNLEHDLAP